MKGKYKESGTRLRLYKHSVSNIMDKNAFLYQCFDADLFQSSESDLSNENWLKFFDTYKAILKLGTFRVPK